jgi:hypothetical protein
MPASFRVREGGRLLLLDTPGVGTFAAAYSLRRLRTAAANKAIQVTRASDSTTQDIGFVGENFDTASLATFCSGTTGYVSKWYDQSGNGRDQIQATQANMWRIYASGATETKNSRPALRAIDNSRGMETASFTAYTGSSMSAYAVAAHQNAVTTLSPRFVGARGTSNTDNSDSSGSVLIARSGSSTPTSSWLTAHQSSQQVTAGTYNQLTQIAGMVDNTAATIDNWIDGTNGHLGSVSPGVYNTTILQVGKATSTTFQSVTDGYIAEALVVFGTISANNRNIVRASQKAYYATS